jgi:hypothetical protein
MRAPEPLGDHEAAGVHHTRRRGNSLAARGACAAVGDASVGYLNSQTAALGAASPGTVGFLRGLKQAGYTEGETVAIEYRWAEEHRERLSMLAADLVARGVRVIFTIGGAASTLAAKAATSTIPIVFFVGQDPVKAGLVESINRPITLDTVAGARAAVEESWHQQR